MHTTIYNTSIFPMYNVVTFRLDKLDYCSNSQGSTLEKICKLIKQYRRAPTPPFWSFGQESAGLLQASKYHDLSLRWTDELKNKQMSNYTIYTLSTRTTINWIKTRNRGRYLIPCSDLFSGVNIGVGLRKKYISWPYYLPKSELMHQVAYLSQGI